MARIKVEDLARAEKIDEEMIRKIYGGLSKYGYSSESQYPIVNDLLDYLRNRPDAGDSLAGISTWWTNKS